MTRHLFRAVPFLAVALLAGAQPATAGPPLLCHPFDIGSARSLPWNDQGAWWTGHSGYSVSNLVADTQALLTPSTPVIVRMALTDRAHREGSAAPGEGLALFDAGYFTETLKQIAILEGETEFRASARVARSVVGNADGYPLVNRSLALRPDDPALEFAAALIARGAKKAAWQQHAEKARRGASRDALLARNIRQLT